MPVRFTAAVAAGVPAAEPHPVLPGAGEIGDREDVLRAAGELDELGKHPAPGGVERDVDAAGRERPDPPGQALAVGDGAGWSQLARKGLPVTGCGGVIRADSPGLGEPRAFRPPIGGRRDR